MSLQRFLSQPSKAFRNSQLFFGAFTISFGVAALIYAAAPSMVTAQFAQWDALLGGGGAGYPEPQNKVWVSLAAGNVATLSLMCFLLVRDFRKYQAVRWPLLFMKTASALLFTLWWVAATEQRSLLVAAVGDYATGVGIWYFARGAVTEIEKADAGGERPVSLLG